MEYYSLRFLCFLPKASFTIELIIIEVFKFTGGHDIEEKIQARFLIMISKFLWSKENWSPYIREACSKFINSMRTNSKQ